MNKDTDRYVAIVGTKVYGPMELGDAERFIAAEKVANPSIPMYMNILTNPYTDKPTVFTAHHVVDDGSDVPDSVTAIGDQ